MQSNMKQMIFKSHLLDSDSDEGNLNEFGIHMEKGLEGLNQLDMLFFSQFALWES